MTAGGNHTTSTGLVQWAREYWSRSSYLIIPLVASLPYLFRGIDSVGLWSDEFYTARAVMDGFGASNGEPAYLPYYTVVWILTGGGTCTSEFCLRLPSAVFMLGAIAAIALTARFIGGPRAGAAAGLLVAISPATQRFGQEARPFALATLLVSSATLALLLGSRSNRTVPWVIYSVLMTLAVLVLPTTLVLVAGHAVILWERPFTRRTYRRFALAWAGTMPILIAAGLWLSRAPSWRGYGDVFLVHSSNLWYGWSSLNASGVANAVGVGELAMAVFILGALTRLGTKWILAALASGALIWLASFGPYSWFMGRFFVPLIGLGAVAAGVGLASLSAKRMWAILLVIAIALLPAYTANRAPWARGPDFRTAIQTIESQWSANDAVELAGDGQFGLAWNYYATTPQRSQADSARADRIWYLNDALTCGDSTTVRELGMGNTLNRCDGPPQ